MHLLQGDLRMKQGLITGYFSIAFIISIFMWLFGEMGYRGYMYNLGKAIVWPVSIFNSYPEIDGSSQKSYGISFNQVAMSGSSQYIGQFYDTIGYLAYYYYAERNPSINLDDYRSLFKSGIGSSELVKALIEDETYQTKMAEYLDGMSFGDIVEEKESIRDDILELLKSRQNK